MTMLPAELLRKKRDGAELSAEEIAWWIEQVVAGSVSEAQIGAFLMAVCIRGLSLRETAALTRAMSQSGIRFHWHHLGKPVVDKHSTGGVGDKLSLLLLPLASACGVLVPMISGRALGHTGGTVDKWESIRGVRTEFAPAELEELLREVGAFLIGQSEAIAPADRILYRIRDVTATVESIGLITASILSKKLVEDLDGLVMDIKVGSGAFLPTLEAARELAQTMQQVGAELGLPIRCAFTRMDTPLGSAVGNWWEVLEAERALADYDAAPPDVRRLTEVLAAQMLLAAGVERSAEDATERVRQVWRNRTAWEQFHRLVRAQGGNWDGSLSAYERTPCKAVLAPASGTIVRLDARTVGLAALLLGAGRRTESDSVDPAAGILLRKKPGDPVTAGEELALLLCSQPERFPAAQELLLSAYTIGEMAPPSPDPLIELLL
jgi:pyrimidine-nucleoside phosphorylase